MNKVIIALVLFTIACNSKPSKDATEETSTEQESNLIITDSSLQQILDSNQLLGSILIYDPQNSTYYTNNLDRSLVGFLPASTFKVVNSLIGLETGILKSLNDTFKWDGKPRRMEAWEQDLSLKQAFHASCVPCYQELARKIGYERMIKYLDTLNYGSMDFDSSEIDVFWLEGRSRVSQMDQLDFLKNLYNKNLPISDETYTIMKDLMVIDHTDEYVLSGKTGWVLRNDMNIGWFVGYVEKAGKVYYVATNVEPSSQFDMNQFIPIRLEVSLQALKAVQIL